MKFQPRLTKPEAGNPYYNTKSRGGYSRAIVGKPTDAGCNVLSNCVGYAFGRFNEILGSKDMQYLAPVNAEIFPEYRGNLKTGKTPKVGAVMVWQKGASLSDSDGAGHVAVVEQVIDSNTVVTSESAYNGTAFYTRTRSCGSGNWGASSPYKFRCFIYLPEDADEIPDPLSAPAVPVQSLTYPLLRQGSTGNAVKVLKWLLNSYGFSCGVSKTFDVKTATAVKKFQKKYGLAVDGIVGVNTWAKLLCWI